jgi:hypothetical protein
MPDRSRDQEMIEEDVVRLSLAVQQLAKGLIMVADEFEKNEKRLSAIEERLRKLESKQ